MFVPFCCLSLFVCCPLFFNLCFVFLQVPTAFPVEPQFTFSNQTQGEPFPLENRSSMGEVQVKTL